MQTRVGGSTEDTCVKGSRARGTAKKQQRIAESIRHRGTHASHTLALCANFVIEKVRAHRKKVEQAKQVQLQADRCNAELTSLQAEFGLTKCELEKQSTDSCAQLQTLRQELESSERGQKQLQQHAAQMLATVELRDNEIATRTAQQLELKLQCESTQNELVEIKQMTKASEQQHTISSEQYVSEQKRLVEQVTELRGQNEQVIAQLTAAMSRNADAKQVQLDLLGRQKQTELELEERLVQQSGLAQQQVAAHKQELESQIQGLEEKHQKQQQESESQIRHLDQLVKEAQQEKGQLASKATQAERESESMSQTCTALRVESSSLEVQLTNALCEGKSAGELKKTVESLESCVQGQNNELCRISTTLEEQTDTNNRLRTALKASATKLELLTQQTQQAHKDVQRARDELSGLKGQMARDKRSGKSVRDEELKALQHRLKQTEKDLEEEEQEHKEDLWHKQKETEVLRQQLAQLQLRVEAGVAAPAARVRTPPPPPPPRATAWEDDQVPQFGVAQPKFLGGHQGLNSTQVEQGSGGAGGQGRGLNVSTARQQQPGDSVGSPTSVMDSPHSPQDFFTSNT